LHDGAARIVRRRRGFGVHGANRLGGNGVANSTVFGAIAGDAMAAGSRAKARRSRCR
jgi:succinate dehydrogenase/fumarate reductase flavoprotein subunit